MTQYVFPCKPGLLRIVKHGRVWRALVNEQEMARHDSAESALMALRAQWPAARAPSSLQLWRCLPEARQLGHRRPQRVHGHPTSGGTRMRA